MTKQEEQLDPMLQTLPVGDKQISFNRLTNLDDHVKQIAKEMPGARRVCIEVVRHIVCIRRGEDPAKNYAKMLELLEKYPKECLQDLSTRWLISICDTVADRGNPQQSANAMIVVTWINTIKMCETMWSRLKNTEYDRNNRNNIELWDGVTTYNISCGDTWINLDRRNKRVLELTPLLHSIYIVLQNRLRNSNTSFNQLAKMRGNFYG